MAHSSHVIDERLCSAQVLGILEASNASCGNSSTDWSLVRTKPSEAYHQRRTCSGLLRASHTCGAQSKDRYAAICSALASSYALCRVRNVINMLACLDKVAYPKRCHGAKPLFEAGNHSCQVHRKIRNAQLFMCLRDLVLKPAVD